MPSSKRYEFGISGQAVRTDIVFLKPLFHVHLASLIETDPAGLHQALNVPLSLLIKARARIAFHHVAGEIEIIRREAGLDIGHERRGQPGVRVGEDVLETVWEVRKPSAPAQVES